jgi:hypothetical protein
VGWKDVLKKARPGTDWAGWAAEHGWRYEPERPELAGRFFELPREPRRHKERYLEVVSGDWNRRPFIAFRRQTLNTALPTPQHENVRAVAIQLPGPPRADLATQDARDVFRSFCDLPGWCNWTWVPPAWLLASQHVMQPDKVLRVVQYADDSLQRALAGMFGT